VKTLSKTEKKYIGGVKLNQELKTFTKHCYDFSCGATFTCHMECGQDPRDALCWCPDCAKKHYTPFSELNPQEKKEQRKTYCKSRFGDIIG
jgi:hypothetical protein